MSAVYPPLPSPMSFDPHRDQLGSLLALASSVTSSSPPSSAVVESEIARNGPLFLGLDLSTQALKGCFTDDKLEVVAEFNVRFDKDLPGYGTAGGVHMKEGGVVTSPAIMFVHAIDLLFERITADIKGKALLVRTVAISGAAQQHGTVYWSEAAPHILGSLDPAYPLKEQFRDAFARHDAPNWQDSSTTQECRDIEKAIGVDELVRRTGSRAHERFSGPQILRLRRTQPEIYKRSHRISLVSSFLTSMLCADGEVKPMEESDACGMNLWNLEKGDDWDPELLKYVGGDAQDLRSKLGDVEKDGGVSAGKIGTYYTQRYGVNPSAAVCHVTGDNNATILSFSLYTGEVVISLGTSDTILLSTTNYTPSPDAHVFSYPANRAGGKRSYMGMFCYKKCVLCLAFETTGLTESSGSLPREYVRDKYAGGDWDTFNRLVDAYPFQVPRPLGFYFLKPEIIPHGAHGVHHFAADGTKIEEFEDLKFNPRAILESQFLSFRVRVRQSPKRIYACGGASENSTVLKTLSTVLQAPVHKQSSNSCALGGSMKAMWCWKRLQGQDIVFEEAVKQAVQTESKLVASPETADYDQLLDQYIAAEKILLSG